MHRAPALLAALLLTALPAAAQQNPDTAGGFEAGKIYQFGELDSVNLFNGNVTVAMPIGGTYPVNGNLSYGLTLSYNSADLWRHVDFKWWRSEEELTTSRVALLRETNAGPGWSIGLGELQDADDPRNEGTQWVYLSPDGGSHAFYDTLHPGETSQTGYLYTRDGSYLRLHAIDGRTVEVESSDGSTRRFRRSFADPGSPFRLEWIEDAFGNRMTITDFGTSWVLSDGHRGHTIYWRTLSNDGQSWRVVDRVELAAFGGQTAVYTFGYTAQSLQESAFDTFPGGENRSVHLLSSITLPDGSTWQMDHYTQRSEFVGGELSAAENQPGALKRLTLPTLGAYEWTYQDYRFPSRGVLG